VAVCKLNIGFQYFFFVFGSVLVKLIPPDVDNKIKAVRSWPDSSGWGGEEVFCFLILHCAQTNCGVHQASCPLGNPDGSRGNNSAGAWRHHLSRSNDGAGMHRDFSPLS